MARVAEKSRNSTNLEKEGQQARTGILQANSNAPSDSKARRKDVGRSVETAHPQRKGTARVPAWVPSEARHRNGIDTTYSVRLLINLIVLFPILFLFQLLE